MPGCARQIQRGGLQRLGIPQLVRPRVMPRQRPLTLLGRVPPLTDCARATLADIEPPRDIDCPEVELEERVIRDGLDHAANAASATPPQTRALMDGSSVTSDATARMQSSSSSGPGR